MLFYEVAVYFDDEPGGDEDQRIEVIEVEGDTPAGGVYRVEDIHFRGEGQYLFFRVRQLLEHGPQDRAWTAPVWFESSGFSPPQDDNRIRMVSLLPNPPGDERQDEAITLRILGTTAVDLSGWIVRDRAETAWVLDALGSLPAGAEVTIQRLGQPMGLNNNGDTVSLISPSGEVIQTVTYSSTTEGVAITVGGI